MILHERRACKVSLTSCDRASVSIGWRRRVHYQHCCGRSSIVLSWDPLNVQSAFHQQMSPSLPYLCQVEGQFIVRGQLVVLKLSDQCVMIFSWHEAKATSQCTNRWWASGLAHNVKDTCGRCLLQIILTVCQHGAQLRVQTCLFWLDFHQQMSSSLPSLPRTCRYDCQQSSEGVHRLGP